ncbi:hypothetical protein CR51_26210 [Caballeronia megalochromosomata]|nr:hypothetical protein CR51_26210 [Caballeronia megalochromosomata]
MTALAIRLRLIWLSLATLALRLVWLTLTGLLPLLRLTWRPFLLAGLALLIDLIRIIRLVALLSLVSAHVYLLVVCRAFATADGTLLY